jgi:hypothetical protein
MTTPDEPIEERALAEMASVLGNLAAWPYPQTPAVLRFLPPQGQQMQSTDLPRVYLVPGRGSNLDGAGVTRGSRLYEHVLHVDVHGVIEGDETILADTWRWRLRKDVLDTLHRHLSLGGLARAMTFTDRPEDVDPGEIAPKAWFTQPVTIRLVDEYTVAP